jgi:Rad3-related DNA helicase
MPDKFKSWFPGQEKIIQEVQEAEQRFIGQVVPTGGGKTACYLAAALLNQKRTLILTATKGLQDQLEADFAGVVCIVKGRSAYQCRLAPYSCQYGPCLWGYVCKFKDDGCPYYDAVEKARESQIVVTNYSFWFANSPEKIGDFSLLVCDEAHAIDEILLDSQSIGLHQQECSRFAAWPDKEQPPAYYFEWAAMLRKLVDEEIAYCRKEGKVEGKDAIELINMQQKLSKLNTAKRRDWTVEFFPEKKRISFDMVWPVGNTVENTLLRGIPNVLMTSATVNRKVFEVLGIRPDSYILTDYPSYFSAYRRPITYLPTVAMDRKITNEGMNFWLSTIDNIIRPRLKFKGIVHTVSYDRALRVQACSEFAGEMLLHDSRTLQGTVARFKQMDAPAMLVSPSIVTGYDFPGDECRWQIIGKLPFPDTRSKVAQARERIDPDYFLHKTMQAIIQACGRSTRNTRDWSECFIIDRHWSWFRRKYQRFIPQWFAEAMRDVATVPEVFNGDE